MALVALWTAATACHREKRDFSTTPPASSTSLSVRVSDLQPGVALPAVSGANPNEGNAYAISEGQRLFSQYNCAGCHANGGGGMGPPLMDETWIYGSAPANIYQTIREGRPNGMPSFAGHIPDAQIWQLVAYVRSLGGLTSQFSSPARSDHMNTRRVQPPNVLPGQVPGGAPVPAPSPIPSGKKPS